MDVEVKKQVLRKLTYGMWVIAAAAGDDVEASSVTWVTQASFKPPLVVVCVRADTHLRAVVQRAGAFALHLLASDQVELAKAFTKPTVVEPGLIGGITYQAGFTGAPILAGFPAWLEAKVTDVVDRGDHTIFVAEVVKVGSTDLEAAPLTLATTGWTYGG